MMSSGKYVGTDKLKGRQVQLDARVIPGDKEPTFGFFKRPTNTSPVRALATLPTIRAAWARYAINNGLSFRTYTLGFQLLEEGDTWLLRGFDALLEHVGKL